jgi:ABC-type multidrug transport system permease subunit
MMMPSSVWRKETLKHLRRRRALVLKVVFPLLISSPLLVASPPPLVTAGALTLLTVMVGIFGVGVGLSHDRMEGNLQRQIVLPLAPGRAMLERLLVAAALEAIQLMPILIVLFVRYGTPVELALLTIVALGGAIVLANALGIAISSAVASSAEMHLYSALAVFPLLAAASVFMPLQADAGWRVDVAFVLPFAHLNQALLQVQGEPALWSLPAAAAVTCGWLAVALAAVFAIANKTLTYEE